MSESRENLSNAEINKSRTLSDAELLKGGAEYVENGDKQPRLELTAEQIEEVRKEFELAENERKEQEKKNEEKEKARAEFSEKIEPIKRKVDEFIESFPTVDNLTESDIEKLFRMRDLGKTSYDGIGEFALEVGLPIEVTSYYDLGYTGGEKVIFKGGRFGNVNWYNMERGEFALIQEIAREIREKLDKFTLKVANEIMEQGKKEFEEYRMNIEHFLSMFKDLKFERGAFDNIRGINAEGFEGNSIAVMGNKLERLIETFEGLAEKNPDSAYRDFLAQAEFYHGVVDRYVSYEDKTITGYGYRTEGYGNYGKGENVSDAVNFLLTARYWPKFKTKQK